MSFAVPPLHSAHGVAWRRRQQQRRSDSRKVSWALGMVQSNLSHHTAAHDHAPAALLAQLLAEVAVLKQQVAALRSKADVATQNLSEGSAVKENMDSGQAAPFTHVPDDPRPASIHEDTERAAGAHGMPAQAEGQVQATTAPPPAQEPPLPQQPLASGHLRGDVQEGGAPAPSSSSGKMSPTKLAEWLLNASEAEFDSFEDAQDYYPHRAASTGYGHSAHADQSQKHTHSRRSGRR